MKINCIAVDDEPLALKLLEDNISKLFYLNLVASCNTAFEAMKQINENKIDLIFIDIQMPGLSGLEFISTLSNKPMVIFITAYKQYALESYDLSVVDYLVKPVSIERFIIACNKARELFELKSNKQNLRDKDKKDYFFINADYSQIKVVFNNIIWMEGVRDYIKIYLKDNKVPLLVRTSLKAIELEIPEHIFLRIHKSYIINKDCITSIRKNSVFINEIELPIGETFRDLINFL